MIYTKFNTREDMEDAILDIGAATVRRISKEGDAAMFPTGPVPYYISQSETDGKWRCMFGGQPSEEAMARLEPHLSDPF